MKIKTILRFYYFADSLDGALDNLILKSACNSGADGLDCAHNICRLIDEKARLGRLWNYLDEVISCLPQGDKLALKQYSATRCGAAKLTDEKRKEIKRALAKFKRRARRLESFMCECAAVAKYYCLICVAQT